MMKNVKINNMDDTILSYNLKRVTDLRETPCLIVISGNDIGKRFVLASGQNIAGRASCSIIIDDPELSRTHFAITNEGDELLIEDLGSTNGTYINDIQLKSKAKLSPGSIIQVGQSCLKVEYKSKSELDFEDKILTDATLDGLTGIMNKRYFFTAADHIIKRAREFESGVAVLIFDLDHFKKVNDTYGHLAGDYILKEFANIVVSQKRQSDIFARFGGEEFVMIFEGENLSEEFLRKFAERIKYHVEYYRFCYEDQPIQVTVSIGASMKSIDRFTSLEALIKEADRALYTAKNTGRNKVYVIEQHSS